MSNGDPKLVEAVRSFLTRNSLEVTEKEEQNCTKFEVRQLGQTASLSVYNTGTLVLGGKRTTKLFEMLNSLKSALESGELDSRKIFPFEIARLPEIIRERMPTVDPVIPQFVEEALKCLRADALLAASFMLGAASERAIGLLIESFVEAVGNAEQKTKLHSRIRGKAISRQYEEFKKSYVSCGGKPSDPLFHDIDSVIGTTFQFCRITRNEIGHPHATPHANNGVILANVAHFSTYIERIYALIEHFKNTQISL